MMIAIAMVTLRVFSLYQQVVLATTGCLRITPKNVLQHQQLRSMELHTKKGEKIKWYPYSCVISESILYTYCFQL